MSDHDAPLEPLPRVTTPDDLLDAVNALADRTSDLSTALTVSTKQQKTTRRITLAFAFFVVLVLVIFANQAHRISVEADSNTSNAMQSCQNANSSRDANRALWTYVINLSSAAPDVSDGQKTAYGALLGWINVLYQDHDCNDLAKVYTIPAPPVITLD